MLRRPLADRMQSTMELGDNVRVETCTGQAIVPLLPELQRLRVTVFRAWPYLYDGDPAQEAAHLRGFVDSAQAAIVVAFGDGAPVGRAGGRRRVLIAGSMA